MASEDPMSMFADMKKKKKKKAVVFNEDPVASEPDPSYPPKEPIHHPSLGPSTAHEAAIESGAGDANVNNVAEAAAGAEDDVKAMFGDLKKKKKKKELPIDGLDEPAAPPVAEESVGPVDDFSDMPKKKKKKKEIPMDLDEAAPTEAPGEGGDMDFADIKKKKKKKELPMDLGEGEAAADGADEFADLKKKKKKKDYNMEEFERELGDMSISKPKKKKEVKIADEEDDDEVPDGAEFEDMDEMELGDNPFAMGAGGSLGAGSADPEPWLSSDRDYTYQELLNRFFRSLHAANPALALSGSKRYTLAPPSIHRDGNKRSVFANIGDICRRMHRQPEHVISFMLAEMGTTGSVDGSGRLVIRGRFQQKQIENILRRYIVEYVTCKTCKSPDTLLTKENRIYFMACESCGSRQSVSAIKTGFQAQVGRRKKAQV